MRSTAAATRGGSGSGGLAIPDQCVASQFGKAGQASGQKNLTDSAAGERLWINLQRPGQLADRLRPGVTSTFDRDDRGTRDARQFG